MIGIIHSMGHSRDDKAKSHERIVEIASARIRESGTATPGVAEIMQAAGLTHGGFYKHFASRDELIAEAADRSFTDSERAFASLTDGAEDPLGAFLDWYLSRDHCENPAAGCGIVALGADAPRSGDRVRAAYTEQVRRYIAHLEALLAAEGESDEATRSRAIAALCGLVGAVLVSRAVDDPSLSDEIRGDVNAAVKSA